MIGAIFEVNMVHANKNAAVAMGVPHILLTRKFIIFFRQAEAQYSKKIYK